MKQNVKYASIMLFPLGLIAFWLLKENHSIWGDEAWHLMFLQDALTRAGEIASGSYIRAFIDLYKFNSQYPPLFYLLSTPLTLGFEDMLWGGRLYSALLFLLANWFFILSLKRLVSFPVALVSVIIFNSFVPIAESFHHYILEAGVVATVMALFYAVLIDREKKSTASAFMLGLVLAVGLLTKISFFIYAFPLILVEFVFDLKDLKDAVIARTQMLSRWSFFCLSPIVLASPWYIWQVFVSGGYLATLRTMHAANVLKPKTGMADWLQSFGLGLQALSNKYLLTICLFSCFVFFISFMFKRGKKLSYMPAFGLWLSLVAIGTYIVILQSTGMWMLIRWNLSYIFLTVVFAISIDQVKKSRNFWYAAVTLPFLVVISDQVIFPIPDKMAFWRLPGDSYAPDGRATGMVEIATLIRDYERGHKLDSHTLVPTFFHIHAGAHSGALTFYFRQVGLPFYARGFANYNQPVDMGVFTHSNYIVLMDNYQADDPEISRYQHLFAHLPSSVASQYETIGTLSSRFGTLRVLHKQGPPFNLSQQLEIAHAGYALEQDPAYKIFWELESLRLEVGLGALSPDQVKSRGGIVIGRYTDAKGKMNDLAYGELEKRIAALRSFAASQMKVVI